MLILLLSLILQVPDFEHNNEVKDPKILSQQYSDGIRIYISDQNDFETEFVRNSFIIPDDILMGKIGFPKHREKWLRARRECKCELIVDPTITGQPLIGFTRTERPQILAYPYKAISDPVTFLNHLTYLWDLFSETKHNHDIYVTECIGFRIAQFDKKRNILEQFEFKLCADCVTFPVSPLTGYEPYRYIMIDNKVIWSYGPTIEEQFHLLDCNMGILTNEKVDNK